MSDIKIKTANGWLPLSSVKTKTENGWKDISEVYAKTATGWTLVWPDTPPIPGIYKLYSFQLPNDANGLYIADEIKNGIPYYQGNPIIL